jgi:transcriptional regulator with XRE-family HTH domain
MFWVIEAQDRDLRPNHATFYYGTVSPQKKPTPPTVRQVAATRVRELRNAKGWSQEQLADALNDIGARIPARVSEGMFDRSTIAKIEGGERGVSLDDVIALAVALGVPPLSIFLPRNSPELTLVPGFVVNAISATHWARGQFPLSPKDDTTDEDWRFFQEASLTNSEWRAREAIPSVGSIYKLLPILEELVAVRDWDRVARGFALVAHLVGKLQAEVETERMIDGS